MTRDGFSRLASLPGTCAGAIALPLKAAAKHVTFGFWKGASIDDPSGRLETSGEVMAHAKLRTRDDVDEKLFAKWLRPARELER